MQARSLVATLVASALAMSALSGCGAIFTQGSVPVTLQSDPAGADVYVDGQLVGKSPLTTMVSNRKEHIVNFQSGGRQMSCTLNASPAAGWIVLDVLLAIIPVVVDAVTNGWTTLDQRSCMVRLAGPSQSAPPVPVAGAAR